MSISGRAIGRMSSGSCRRPAPRRTARVQLKEPPRLGAQSGGTKEEADTRKARNRATRVRGGTHRSFFRYRYGPR